MRIMPLFLRASLTIGLVVALAACTSVRKKVPTVEVDETTSGGVTNALQAPLYDLNIKRDKIPAALLQIDIVYGVYAEDDCGALRAEIHDLTRVLGPDISDLEKSKRGKIVLKPEEALGGAVSSLIPYGDVVRWVSGASRHQKKIAGAYFRGHLRRAFLKGRLSELRCTPVPRLNPIIEHQQKSRESKDIPKINLIPLQ